MRKKACGAILSRVSHIVLGLIALMLLQADDCRDGGTEYDQPTDDGAKPVCKIPAEVHIRKYEGDPTTAMIRWGDQTLSKGRQQPTAVKRSTTPPSQ
jgi:hypothetical protein